MHARRAPAAPTAPAPIMVGTGKPYNFLDEALSMWVPTNAAERHLVAPENSPEWAVDSAHRRNVKVAELYGLTALLAGGIYFLGGRWLCLLSPPIGMVVILLSEFEG